ncbi:AFG1-like ATPase-domain-containing protein [Dipodascopsis uninucleata]
MLVVRLLCQPKFSHHIRGRAALSTSATGKNSGVQQPAATPLAEYDRMVAAGTLNDDKFQRQVITRLEKLHSELMNYTPKPSKPPKSSGLSGLASLFGLGKKSTVSESVDPSVPKGIYLYGDVGCGLTRTRIHFHAFMQSVHRRAHELRIANGSNFDTIPILAHEIAMSASVFCFDEFQVVDVADAMVLRRLYDALISDGVVFFMTSNRAPDELYKNGIQRSSFIPCINQIKQTLDVICLDSPTDYRSIERPRRNVYHFPLDAAAADHVRSWFEYFAGPEAANAHPAEHTIWGRPIHVPRAAGRVAQFKFDELCGQPLSAADYLELARHYNVFIVTDIPLMSANKKDVARRFITFIDAVYESHGKLIATFEAPPSELFVSEPGSNTSENSALLDAAQSLGVSLDELRHSSMFTGDEEVFAFARALSRLNQMSSAEWVDA